MVLAPGGTAEVEVAIQRNNEYGGRVPVEVRNLPPGVRVLDVGLNGVLITETENRRKFVLAALPSARPIEQPIIVAGDIETRAGGQQNSYAAGAGNSQGAAQVTSQRRDGQQCHSEADGQEVDVPNSLAEGRPGGGRGRSCGWRPAGCRGRF